MARRHDGFQQPSHERDIIYIYIYVFAEAMQSYNDEVRPYWPTFYVTVLCAVYSRKM